MEESDDQHSGQMVVVALGSNLPGGFASTHALLEAAVREIEAAGFQVLRRSRWWRSAAWPDPNEPPYLNGVVVAETGLDLPQALSALHTVEAEFGRRRTAANAPRTLDLDLIAYEDVVSSANGVVVPHPRAAERLFVMGPLAELLPDWRHPVLGVTAKQLAAKASVGQDAAPI